MILSLLRRDRMQCPDGSLGPSFCPDRLGITCPPAACRLPPAACLPHRRAARTCGGGVGSGAAGRADGGGRGPCPSDARRVTRRVTCPLKLRSGIHGVTWRVCHVTASHITLPTRRCLLSLIRNQPLSSPLCSCSSSLSLCFGTGQHSAPYLPAPANHEAEA